MRMFSFITFSYLLIVLVIITLCNEDNCIEQESCNACVRKPQCIWCSHMPGSNMDRCQNRNKIFDDWCQKGYLIAPKNNFTVIHDEPLQTSPKVVQIQPQLVQVKLRLKEPQTITLKYQQANDYPVDLYYLMDLSHSMKKHKDKLSFLGSKLAIAMRNITKNFRLGFGSFVDKPAMPYINILATSVKDCPECELPYSFRHRMNLSEDDKSFEVKVHNTPMSTNLDIPEGGFDALLQAIVCTKEIGWRQQARRLLVLSTDAPSHLAGDGRLAGVYLPHDGNCYLKDIGGVMQYTEALNFDYPSLGLINRMANEYNMNVIFAVTQNVENIYKKITEQIRGSSYGILDENSENVIKLVLKHYESLSDKVQIVNNAPSEHFQVELSSKCFGDEIQNISHCEGVRVGNPIEFQAKIMAVQCPIDAGLVWKHVFKIQPLGLEEALHIEAEVFCGCECDQEGHLAWTSNDTNCSHWPMRCGVCQCPKHLTGRHCECSVNLIKSSNNTNSCRKNEASPICSDLGVCKCGVCDCNKRSNPNEVISGQFCQCDNFSCKRSGTSNLVCSGPEHGSCVCGKCECHPGWSGPDCACRSTKETCIRPGDTMLCSNFGECICGVCVCQQGYFGTHCQNCSLAICSNVDADQCPDWTPCVKCQIQVLDQEKDLSEDINRMEICRKQNITCPKEVEFVDTLPEKNESIWRHCLQPGDEQNCMIAFVYAINGQLIYIQRTRECPLIVNLLGVVLGVIGSTIIIGLLFLIAWKVITSIHDQREYIKFEKERAMANWDRGDNPLYKPSTSTFSNPTFGS